MLVHLLRLNRVKCFAETTAIDMTAGTGVAHRWVVIYGDNGLGKSTLLRALGMALTGQPALSTLFPSAEGWVRAHEPMAAISVSVQKGTGDKSTGGPRTRPVWLALGLVGKSSVEIHTGVQPAHSTYLFERWHLIDGEANQTRVEQLNEDVKLFRKHISSDEPKRGWLICGYGPHRRLTGGASELSEKIPQEGRAARLVTLFHERAALSSSERWLLKLHHYALLNKGVFRRRLDAIVEIVNTSLLHGAVQLHKITPEGVFFKTPFSANIPFGDLSDGYRSILALTLDLLRHIEYSFDIESVLEKKGDRWIVTAEGVVLIDEIDAHLHPSWQRTIGAWLHERFPNIQFIVTTHSPLIATRVSETDGLVLRLVRKKEGKGKGEVVDVITEEGTFGLTADQNLTGPNFGLATTRDVLAEDMADEIERLRVLARAKKATPKERKKLRELEVTYDRIAPATPTYAGIEAWREEGEQIRLANEPATKRKGAAR